MRMSLKVKANLIVDEAAGILVPVQHIREMSVYGGTVLVKLSGVGSSTLQMPEGKTTEEIMSELSDAYLKAYRNYEARILSPGEEAE